MLKEIRVVTGPHSHGLTLQLSEDVTVYVGLPAPGGVARMSDSEIEVSAKRAAVRALKIALDELEAD